MKIKNWIYPFILTGMMMLFTMGCSSDDGGDPTSGNQTPVTGWSVLGNLDVNGVYDLYVDNNGHLFAAGAFTNSNGKRYVAKWDGSNWSEVGTLDINGNIFAICGDSNGNLYIGGAFTDNSGNTYVAKWNGSSWVSLGSLTYSGYINDLFADAAGNIYMAADGLNFDGTLAGNVSVVKWNGSGWQRVGSFLYTDIIALCIDGTGNIYAGGGSGSAAPNGGYVAKWNGSDWDKMSNLDAYEKVYTLCADANGNLYAGGGFDFTSGFAVKWSNGSWVDLGLNANDKVKSLCADPDGNLYAGGKFYNSQNKFYVAKWDGNSWTDLGLNAYSGVNKLLYSNGNLYAAGFLQFQLNGGHYIAVYR